MTKTLAFLIFTTVSFFATAQRDFFSKGAFASGVRSSVSFLNQDDIVGFGSGAHIQLGLLDGLMVQVSGDFFTSDLNGAGTKNSTQIGGALVYYPLQNKAFTPTILVGYLQNNTVVVPFSSPFLDRSEEVKKQWNSALQFGAGFNYWITSDFSLSVTGKYVYNFGNQLNYQLEQTGEAYYLNTMPTATFSNAAEARSTLLVTVGLNYVITHLWN